MKRAKSGESSVEEFLGEMKKNCCLIQGAAVFFASRDKKASKAYDVMKRSDLMQVTGSQIAEKALTHLGMPYIFGMKGEVLTKAKYEALQKQYGKGYVWDSDRQKIGKVCCDCSGLLYLCIKELRGGIYNYGSTQLYEKGEKYSIKAIDTAPIGASLWMPGHTGIYIGKGEYVAEDGSKYNCRKAPLRAQNWTHYLLMPYITYENKQVQKPSPAVGIYDEQLAKAVSKLIRAGAPIDYNAWKREELMNLKYADALVIKVTNGVFKQSFKSYGECIDFLAAKNIINTSSVWLDRSALKKTAFVAILLIKTASAI